MRTSYVLKNRINFYMGFITGTLILSPEGYCPIERIEVDDYIDSPTGSLKIVTSHEIEYYTGDIYHITTDYHCYPLQCTGDQSIVVRNSPSGYKPVKDIVTGDWIGMWCPCDTSRALPVTDEPIETYADALFIQFAYFSHRRIIKILETYDHRYLCVESCERITVWFDGNYVWVPVLYNRCFFQRGQVHSIGVEGGHCMVQGILV